jgi:hypothetical protein
LGEVLVASSSISLGRAYLVAQPPFDFLHRLVCLLVFLRLTFVEMILSNAKESEALPAIQTIYYQGGGGVLGVSLDPLLLVHFSKLVVMKRLVGGMHHNATCNISFATVTGTREKRTSLPLFLCNIVLHVTQRLIIKQFIPKDSRFIPLSENILPVNKAMHEIQ